MRFPDLGFSSVSISRAPVLGATLLALRRTIKQKGKLDESSRGFKIDPPLHTPQKCDVGVVLGPPHARMLFVMLITACEQNSTARLADEFYQILDLVACRFCDGLSTWSRLSLCMVLGWLSVCIGMVLRWFWDCFDKYGFE